MAFFPGFSSSSALFALHSSGSATSHERGVLFCTTFAHPISDELFYNLVAQFVGVATIRPDGSPQSSPLWFVWDGAYIQFTPATNRQKYRNIRRDPPIAFSITPVD